MRCGIHSGAGRGERGLMAEDYSITTVSASFFKLKKQPTQKDRSNSGSKSETENGTVIPICPKVF